VVGVTKATVKSKEQGVNLFYNLILVQNCLKLILAGVKFLAKLLFISLYQVIK
jgi:hypothetical protein